MTNNIVEDANTPETYRSVFELVREFHEVYGQAIRTIPTLDIPERKMRAALIAEEAQEFADAEAAGDLVEMADALADLLYVVVGAAYTLGVNLEAVLAEVQRSNMSKLGVDGLPIRILEGPKTGKIVKGPNFSEPDIATVLKKQGWTGV